MKIYCENNNQEKSFPLGTKVKDMLTDFGLQREDFAAVFVNRKIKNLEYLVHRPKSVLFVKLEQPEAWRMYIRSLCFLLYKAIKDLYPEAKLRIEYPIAHSYFFYCEGHTKIEAKKLQQHMEKLIKQDLPILRCEEKTDKVIRMLEQQGVSKNTTELLKYRRTLYSVYYELQGTYNIFFGSLLSHTGLIKRFEVSPFREGFLLRVPQPKNASILPPLPSVRKIYDIFQEQSRWNALLGFSNVNELNEMCCKGKAYDTIKLGEALHEKKIVSIAEQFSSTKEKKVILISGPSSSGKTTFSKRLSIQLMVSGRKPKALSIDNYFVNRKDTPLDEQGNYDFEHLHAVDLNLFQSHVNDLLNGKPIEVPTFDFSKGERYYSGETMQLHQDEVLVIEGIHALNPELMSGVDDSVLFRVYVSALTTHSLNDLNWISTSDTRLLRRLIRDYNYRSYTAQETISRWQSVQAGEKKWIFPFQENADAMFNSALIYEISVLRKFATPLLLSVREQHEEYSEARRLLKFLSYFKVIEPDHIPPTSLLREFVGGSSFNY